MRPFKNQHKPAASRNKNWTSTRIRMQEAGRRPNWRETSEFQITITYESDLESSNEEENSPVNKTPPQQLEELKLQAQTALKEKKELEKKLAQVMSQLEETKNNTDRTDRKKPLEPEIIVANARPPERSGPPEQTQHLEYTRSFLNRDRVTTTLPGTMTLQANELERDLHLTDYILESNTETYYAPPQETKLQFFTPAKRVVKDHKEAIDNEKEKLADIITKIKLLEMNNVTGQFDKDIKLEEEKYRRFKQLYIGQKQELMRAEKIEERYQPTLEMPEFREPSEGYRRQCGTLSMKNIINNVPKFDPDNEHGKFSYTCKPFYNLKDLNTSTRSNTSKYYLQCYKDQPKTPTKKWQDKATHSNTCWTHLQTSMLQGTQSKKTRKKWTTSQGKPRNPSVQ